MKPDPAALRIALTYLGAGILWIVTTDWLLRLVRPEALALGQTVKGLLFVALSTVLIGVLASRALGRRYRELAEHERMRQRLVAIDRLESIGRLTAGIAHDFNNLLTSIIGHTQSFLDRLKETGHPAPLELREARRSADRAAEVTRRLLAFGRQQVLRPRRIEVNATVQELAALLQRLIGDRVRIRLQLAEAVWPLHVDPGRLEQVVMNLAINARDAMPDGGDLVIATSNVILPDPGVPLPRSVAPGAYVRLEVTDTGSGMDADTQARIYEPFFTTKPKGVGTGLGLSTVYGIVNQSQGHITVRSAPGEGTTFAIYLPRAWGDEPAAVPEVVAASIELEGPGTVLVVDDDEGVRSFVGRALRRSGFAVVEAAGAAEALEVLRADRPRIDLLLTDVSMPGMSGLELIEGAKRLGRPIRALLMSGHPESPVGTEVPHLAKPFTPAALVKRVREVLDENQRSTAPS